MRIGQFIIMTLNLLDDSPSVPSFKFTNLCCKKKSVILMDQTSYSYDRNRL